MFSTLDSEAFAWWQQECVWDPAWNEGFDPTDSEPPFEPVSLVDLPPMDTAAMVVEARLAAVREQLAALAVELPAAARVMEAYELLDAAESLQSAANLLGSADQAVVAQLDREKVWEPQGATSTVMLLVDRLRIRPAEAKRRVKNAHACAERVQLDGQTLPPEREAVAAAQAAGDISPDHAEVIAGVLNRLPRGIPVDELDAIEQVLVTLAGRADPTTVAEAGRRTVELYDPDGPEPRDELQRRRRSLTVWQRDDGTGVIRGELTADLYVRLQTVLSPLAKPRNDAHGDDERTPQQRLHDALDDVCSRLLRSGTLPDSGGVPATVGVTISFEQLRARTGRVSTDFGDVSFRQFLHLACEAEIIPVYLNSAGGIMGYGHTKRLATAAQTKALRARDRGCSFPGCRRPPEWTERHHVDHWIDLGDTDVAKLCLLCRYHHHSFEKWGWQVDMINGVPWWTPPATLDPDQTPIRNSAHGALGG